MKDIVLAIMNQLKADTNIAAAVGTQVFRAKLEPGYNLPSIVVSRIDAIRPNDTKEDYINSRVQVTVYANTDGLADDICEMVTNTLNRYVNSMLGGIYIVSMMDQGSMSDNNPEIGIWMYHRDFMVNYR